MSKGELPHLVNTSRSPLPASVAQVMAKKCYVGGQLCFAHPPTESLNGASLSYDHITIILDGGQPIA